MVHGKWAVLRRCHLGLPYPHGPPWRRNPPGYLGARCLGRNRTLRKVEVKSRLLGRLDRASSGAFALVFSREDR